MIKHFKFSKKMDYISMLDWHLEQSRYKIDELSDILNLKSSHLFRRRKIRQLIDDVFHKHYDLFKNLND